MPFEKYFVKNLTPEMVKKAEKELGETEEVKIQCLKEIKKLIKEEPDFSPCVEDVFLLRFLRTKKFNVEKAFKTLQNFYKFKATYSGILTDFKVSDVREFLLSNLVSALEYRDSNGVAYALIQYGKIMEKFKYEMDYFIIASLTIAEIAMQIEATQVCGYGIIVDLAGMSWLSTKRFASPTFIYRLITIAQDIIPVRMKAVHFINEPLFFNLVVNVAKPFMKEKFAKRIHLHRSSLESLHKHVPPEILPEELNGKQEPFIVFTKDWIAWVLNHEEYINKMNKYGYTSKALQQLTKGNSNAANNI